MLGLLIGASIGLGVLALKEYIGEQVTGLLEDEVSASCKGCHFAVDSVSVSFLRLRVSATNPRIEKDGKTALSFKRIDVYTSLRHIRDHRIILSRIDLRDGFADGVGPDSPTFQFIDHLTEPLPPERARPDRWRAQLQELRVLNSKLREPFARSDLIGEGVSMEMSKDEHGDFILQPSIETLRVISHRNPQGPGFRLGKLTSTVKLADAMAQFQAIRLTQGNSSIEGSALSHNHEDNRLEGDLNFRLSSPDFAVPRWLGFDLQGKSVLSGSLGRPHIDGQFQNAPDAALQFLASGQPKASYDSVDGTLAIRVQRGESSVEISDFNASQDQDTLSSTSSLSLHNEDVAGTLAFRAEILSFEDGTFHGLKGTVSLGGTDEHIRVRADGQADALVSHGFTFKDMNVGLTLLDDSMNVEFSHASEALGSISGQGRVDLSTSPPTLAEMSYQYSDFALFQPSLSGPENQVLESLRFSGAGTAHGPLQVSSTLAQARFTLASAAVKGQTNFQGEADYRSGNLIVRVQDTGESIKALLRFPLATQEQSHLSLHAHRIRPEDLFPSLECLEISGDAEYDFSPSSPWVGTGLFTIAGLQFGCAPYAVALEHPAEIKINTGNAALTPASFKGPDSSVLLQGNLSALKGFDLYAQGRLEINSLVALLPAVDDLRGKVTASLRLQGPVTAPVLLGEASVENGEFSIESTNISGTDIRGSLKLKNSTISIENLDGIVNGGAIHLGGEWVPMEPEKSTLRLTATGISLDPFPNTTMQLGGELELKEPASGIPSIEGNIRIENGEFQKNLDIANLIRALSDVVFSRSPEVAQNRALPRMDLSISVSASRNLYMYTNWAGAEFKGDIIISGDINAPQITGQVETLTGWFGIRDRRFDITSGTLTFKSNSSQPYLEIIGETYVPSYTGDTILIIAEARGPLTAPKISFSSDRGLSEREILNLLAIGGGQGGQTLVNTASRDLELDSTPLFDEVSLLNVPKLLRGLTKFNSLSLQPTYNAQTGLIEPSIVAERKLTEALALVGESTIGAISTESRLKLLYDLTSRLKIAGIAESVSTRQQNALGVDVTLTVLAKQVEFLTVDFAGNHSIERSKLMKGARLTVNSRVPIGEEGRIAEAMRDYYQDQGYLSAKVTTTCSQGTTFCRHLLVHITEGEPRLIRAVTLAGDEIGSIINLRKLTDIGSQTAASRDTIESLRDKLIRALRSEGYIAAKVDGRYVPAPDSPRVDLELAVRTGKPVSFTFRGNTHFSAEEFLETINLLTRKQPFGNNTINILVQNMERLYREAGYLFATISSTKEEDGGSGRITYAIEINEDEKAEVSGVTIVGNKALELSEIDKLSAEIGLQEHERLFLPHYAVAEEIEQNVALLKNLYIEQGFPHVNITYQVVPQEKGGTVNIVYKVDEGGEVRADILKIEGFPAGLDRPSEPPAPYSIPKANRYIDDLLNALKDRGYLNPALWSDIDAESQRMTIHVQPGELTRIGSITYEGTEGIDPQIIGRNLKIAEGAAWDSESINDSKRKLLRLGLFSRVEILPADGVLDTAVENLVIRVSERPLRTLELGGGANSELGLHVFGEATDRELFGDGRSLSLRSDIYYDPAANDISQGVAGLRYSDPYLLSSDFSLAEELRYEKLNLTTLEYDLNRISLTSYVYRSWDEGFTTSFGHTILADDINSVSPGAILSPLDEGNVKLSILSAVFGLDRRDSPLNPRHGYNLNLETRLASEAILSDANFAGLTSRASYITPLLGTRFSLAMGVRGGSAWSFGNTEEIPITQRYYLGGRNSVRGYKENSLGPRGSDGSVLGGNMFLSGSTEARYLFEDNLSTHVFLDAGNVFLRGNEDTTYALRYSAGVGLRFLSPIGPIGFDIGHPLDRKDGEAVLRFHFNIGTNF